MYTLLEYNLSIVGLLANIRLYTVGECGLDEAISPYFYETKVPDFQCLYCLPPYTLESSIVKLTWV